MIFLKKEKIKELDKNLKNYLLSLDFEDIKIIQVVMFIGRDKTYNKSLTTAEIYDDYMDYYSNHIGFNTKEVEVYEMSIL